MSACVRFRDIPSSPNPTRIVGQLSRFVHGKDQDLTCEPKSRYLSGGIKSIQDGHRYIEQNDIGSQPPGRIDSLLTVSRFSTDFPLGPCLANNHANHFSHDFMVVNNENGYRHLKFSYISRPNLAEPSKAAYPSLSGMLALTVVP